MSWAERAACIDFPADMFFPGSQDDPTAALEVCSRCPVRTECLDEVFSMSRQTDYGIRGGMTQTERRDLHKARRKTS